METTQLVKSLAVSGSEVNAYPIYKDSAVERLGEIPEHWEVKKLKLIAKIFNGDSLNESLKKKYSSENLEDLAYISSKDINVNDSSITYENGLRIPKDNLKLKVAPKNTSLLCIEGGSAGRKIAFTNQDVCFVNKLACFVPLEVISKYLFYSLKGNPFQKQFKLSMSGLIGGVAISSINNFNLPFPPLPEQTAIAKFLDDKTEKIDQAISIKEQQIALLKERKQTLIHKAVTRGLDDSVPLKDSGIEWIGEIPEHWEVKALRYVFSLGKGLTITKANLTEKGVLCINYGEIHSRYGFELDTNVHELQYVDEEYISTNPNALIKEGDFVFADTSEDIEGSGNFTYLKSSDEIFAGYHTVVARPKKELYSRFFAYVFESTAFRNQIRVQVKGVKVYSITQTILKRPSVWFPAIEEQKQIVNFLDNETKKIDTAVNIKQQEIERLKEYKRSLINSVVTGKVKVC